MLTSWLHPRAELRAPFGPKPIGDFAEYSTRAQGALGAIIGCRQIAVGREDEEVSPGSLDHGLQFEAGLVRRLARHEFIEARVEPRGVGLQRRVGESFPSLADPAGANRQMAQVGRVDRILHVANEMGETDLMILLRKAHLPDIRADRPARFWPW